MLSNYQNHCALTPFHKAKEWGRFGFFLFWLLFVLPLPSLAQETAREAATLSRRAATTFHLLQHYQKADSIAFYQHVVETMRLSLRSDSLDRLPDKKGRIKPRWQEENTKRIVVLHPLLINAGVYFSRHQYPMMGVDALKLYLTARQHPSLMNTTDEQGVAYYYLSTIYFQSHGYRQADHYANMAMEYAELALPAAEMKARCMHATMTTEADSIRYLAVLHEFYISDPSNPTYFAWIMQFYEHPTPQHNIDQFIDSELEQNPHSVTPWILKGEVAMHNRNWMEAVEAYREADAIDDTSIPVIYNIGLCLTYEAHAREDRIALARYLSKRRSSADYQESPSDHPSHPNDPKQPFNNQQVEDDGLTIHFLWQEASRYLERVREMDPRRNKVDWVTPLCTVYEKLGKKTEADELRPLVRTR